MTTTLNASTAGAGGFIATSDNSGLLALQTAGTTAVSIDASQRAAFVAGTAALPAITTTGDTNTGIYFPAADTIAFTEGGAEAMRIDSSGDVLIGTTSYGGSGNAKTRVYKTGNRPNLEVEQGDSGGYNFQSIAFNNGGTYYHCNFQEGGTQRGSITSNGSNTAYNTGSDYRLKDDITPMTGALNKISALKPVAWKWKSNGSDGQGFLAHELQEIVPECVTGAKDAVDENENPVYQMVDVSYLIATLTAALQETKALIDTQAETLTQQAETINALTARIVALETE